MKHLFQVHSFATFAVACAVIRHEGIDPEDCRFISMRGFVCPALPEGAGMIELRSRAGFRLGSLGSIRRLLYTLRASDAEVQSQLDGMTFHLYLPQSWFDASHIVMSHPLCSGFSYIEEGLTSYYRKGEIDRPYPPRDRASNQRIMRAFWFRKRLPRVLSFFDEGYHRAYGFTDDSFPGWERRVTLGLPESLLGPANGRVAAAPLLVFDAVVELGKAKVEALAHGVSRLIDQLIARGQKHLRYKFHGGQTLDGSITRLNEVFQAYSEQIHVEALPADTVLEELIAAEDFEMYVFNSAAGLYAALAGARVSTINEFVTEVDVDYRRTVGELPEIYARLVPAVGETVPTGEVLDSDRIPVLCGSMSQGNPRKVK